MHTTLRLLKSNPRLPGDAEWIDGLSAERYRPMLRLLDHSDMEFLSRRSGFDPRSAVRLRRQRCDIFAGYLASLNAEFRQTCRALRVLLIHSAEDRSTVALALARRQLAFAVCMMRARWRLRLYRHGFGAVDAARLIRLFESMCAELRRVSARLGPAAAPMVLRSTAS